MADEIVSAADSAPQADVAPATSETATPSDGVTHGGTTSETTDAGQAADPAESDADDADGDEESLPETATDEEKTQAQKRRERRERREAKRVEDAVTAELTRRETTRQAEASAAEAQRKTESDAAVWQERFSTLVGTDETRSALAKEIDGLTSEIAGMRPYADGTDLDALDKKQELLQQKVAERNRLDFNQNLYRQLDEFQFANTQGVFASKASAMPEAHRATYLASHTIDEALSRLEAGIRADEQAKAKAGQARAEAEWSEKYERERAAHEATRTGAPADGPAPIGRNGSGGNAGTLTPTRYSAMSYEERIALRSTPEGRRQIDAMTRAQGGTRNPV